MCGNLCQQSWLKMSDIDNSEQIYKTSVLILKVSSFLSILNVIYSALVVFYFGENPMSESLSTIRTIFSYILSSVVGLSFAMVGLYASRSLRRKVDESEGFFVRVFNDLKYRYKNSNLKVESVGVLREIQELNVNEDSPLFDAIFEFRRTVLDNLLHRVNLSILINMVLSFFVYYNFFVLLIYYTKADSLEDKHRQIFYLTLNVVNPLVSLVFSYLVVMCDNVNSIKVFIDTIKGLRREPHILEDELINQVKLYTNMVKNPFIQEIVDAS